MKYFNVFKHFSITGIALHGCCYIIWTLFFIMVRNIVFHETKLEGICKTYIHTYIQKPNISQPLNAQINHDRWFCTLSLSFPQPKSNLPSEQAVSTTLLPVRTLTCNAYKGYCRWPSCWYQQVCSARSSTAHSKWACTTFSFPPVSQLIIHVVHFVPTTETPITEEPGNLSAPGVLGIDVRIDDLFSVARSPINVQFSSQTLSNYPNNKSHCLYSMDSSTVFFCITIAHTKLQMPII